jgi:protein-tyrosine-phosphatase
MRIILEESGYSGEEHRSQPISEELMSWADTVVTMANAHVKHIEANYTSHVDKLCRWYVDDPHFSSDPVVHHRVFNEIRTHVLDHFG